MSSRRNTACLVAVLLGILPVHASARGRSFPIEVTGTIISVDRGKTQFTIQVDEPACVLTIAIGHDCKFEQNGAHAEEHILRPGARMKVSYFATIFTGDIAVEIESNPVPKIKRGIIEKIDRADRNLDIRLAESSCHLRLRWAVSTRFYKNGKAASAAALRENAAVEVSYFSPAFARKYAVRIELDSQIVK
jgi:hypothetical protein